MFDLLPFGEAFSMALAPVNLAAAAANTNYANTRDCGKFLYLVFFFDVGAASENVTINLQQALDAAGTGVKAMNIKDVYFKRASGTFATAPVTNDVWRQSLAVARDAAAASYNSTADRVASTNQFMGVVRISPNDLDVANGFRFVRAQFTDPGATAQLGFALWISEGHAYQGPSIPSILA